MYTIGMGSFLDSVWSVSGVTKTIRGVSCPLISLCRSECCAFTKKRPLGFGFEPASFGFQKDTLPPSHLATLSEKVISFSNYFLKFEQHLNKKTIKTSGLKRFDSRRTKNSTGHLLGHDFYPLFLLLEGRPNGGEA